MSTITVNGNTVDPEAPEYQSPDVNDSNFILVQCHHNLSVEEKQRLVALHVELQEYVADYTYLCRYLPKSLDEVRALEFVRSANTYSPGLKATVSLKQKVEGEANRTEYKVDVILHDTPNVDASALVPYIAEGANVDPNDMKVLPNRIRLTVHQDRLDRLTELDSVNRIEEVRQTRLFNDLARGILKVNEAPLNSTNNTIKYQGTGQVVCVADSGFDQGEAQDTSGIKVHPAFAGRVERLTVFNAGNKPNDPVGHGTHVCGSVCGDGAYKDANGNTISIKGSAPAARLMVQSLTVVNGSEIGLNTPGNMSDLFQQPFNLGIRIHTNSWGYVWDELTGQIDYEIQATTMDKFIRQNPEFNVLVAAGNDAEETNHGVSQIGGNSSAKNCITVGATGTSRPNNKYIFTPGSSPASGPNDAAAFSSRGPTKVPNNSIHGRIKPDIVAPGVAILSAASRFLDAKAKFRTEYGPPPDKDWCFASGTSMATPLVAGCVALLREALQKRGKQRPSAALIKALLVNGAVSPSKSAVFDYEQGFGRVNVTNSITMIEQSSFIDGGAGLEATKFDVQGLPVNGKWESPPIVIPSGGSKRLVATLAYPDIEGGLLQNDMNLIVQVGNAERHGNMGAGTGFDTFNNVEKVIWDSIPTGSAKIIVRATAFTLPTSIQSFAVTWGFF